MVTEGENGGEGLGDEAGLRTQALGAWVLKGVF
eukprot:CAMPEP_0196654648 /NCGR_PEP_ID=MMETSP1086-20130531/4379_1 /TAXON_ID=77921 /ORGANISM="Cyanoptyche  gloeocystis , Strain SAG4.97" /LENGTH=32 /DNA_ID= /DNA_START= /DNA_END= /DNA_ORIENTATION=